jgi:uncharacterized membrane protein
MYKNFAITFIVSLCLFILLDFLWFKLYSYKNIYQQQFKSINNGNFPLRIWYGLIVWVLMAITVSWYLSIYKSSHLNIFLYGMLLGFLIYGIYNFTNIATIKKYTLKTSLIDTLWGTILFGTVSLICSYLS